MSLKTHDSDSLPYTGSPPSSDDQDANSQPPSLHSTAIHLVPAMTAPQTRKPSVAPSTRTFSSETTTATIPLVVGPGGYNLDHYPTWTRKCSRSSFFSDEITASTSDIFSHDDTENEYDTSTPNWPYMTNPPSLPDEVLFRRGFWDSSLNDKDDWDWGWDTGARFNQSVTFEGENEDNDDRWERVSESGVGFEMEWGDDESMSFFQSSESLGQLSYVRSDAGMTESEEVLHVIVENSEEGNTGSPSQYHGGSHIGSTETVSVGAGPSPLTATRTRSFHSADAMGSANSNGIHARTSPYNITTARNLHNQHHHRRPPHRENTYSSQQSRQSLHSIGYSPTQNEPIHRSYGQSIVPSRHDSGGSQKHLPRPRENSDSRKHSSSTQQSSTQQPSSAQRSRSASSTYLAPAPIRQESWDPRKASSSTQQSSGQQSSGQQSSTQQSSSVQQSSTQPSNATATTSSMQLYQTNATSLDLPKSEAYGGHTDAESNIDNEDAHDDEQIRPDSDGYYMLHDEIPFVIEFDEPEAWLGPNAPRNESGTSQQKRSKSRKALPKQLKKILTLPSEAHSSADKVGELGGHKKKKRDGKEREGRRDGRRVSTRREVMQIVGEDDLKDKGKGRIGWKWGWGM